MNVIVNLHSTLLLLRLDSHYHDNRFSFLGTLENLTAYYSVHDDWDNDLFPGSPRFSVLQATESWAGPGNKSMFGWFALHIALGEYLLHHFVLMIININSIINCLELCK